MVIQEDHDEKHLVTILLAVNDKKLFSPLFGYPEDVCENFTLITGLVDCPWHFLQMGTLLIAPRRL